MFSISFTRDFLPIVQIPNDQVVTSSPWSQLLQATLLTIVDGREKWLPQFVVSSHK